MGRIMKILGIITIMALLVGGGATASAVAASEVPVGINAPDEVEEDNDFTATIDIGEVTDLNAAQYDVSFDNAVLRLDDITSGQIGSTEIPVVAFNEISPGTYRVVQSLLLDTVGGSGYLAVFHFHAIGSTAQSSAIDISNGILSGFEAEILATWVGDSVKVATAVAEDATPPAVVNSPPEDAAPPTVVESPPEATTPPTVVDSPPEATTPSAAVDSAPEDTAPNKAVPLPDKPINWPMLWGAIGGVVVTGLIIFLLARRKAY